MLWANAGGEGVDVAICCSATIIPLILWLVIRSIRRDSAIEAILAIFIILLPYIAMQFAVAGERPTDDRDILSARDAERMWMDVLEWQLAIAVLSLLWVGLRFTVRRWRVRRSREPLGFFPNRYDSHRI